MSTSAKVATWAGILLILATGLIHFVDMPSSFDDAFYKGLLFAANGIGAAIAAAGIYRGAQRWGWLLGGLVAGGAFIGYIISRTVGLPGLPPDDWTEPLGLASLVAEGLFMVTALYSWPRRPALQRA